MIGKIHFNRIFIALAATNVSVRFAPASIGNDHSHWSATRSDPHLDNIAFVHDDDLLEVYNRLQAVSICDAVLSARSCRTKESIISSAPASTERVISSSTTNLDLLDSQRMMVKGCMWPFKF